MRSGEKAHNDSLASIRRDSLSAVQKVQHERAEQEKEHQDKQASAEKAQALTMDLYNMLDKKQARKALEKFEQAQGFLVAAIDPEAYATLDHTLVCGAIMELTEPLEAGKRNQQTAMSPQRRVLDKIYDLMKDDKIEAAYAQFKFGERSLADFMAKGEFPLLKSLMEGAYKDRKTSGVRSSTP